MAVLGHMPTNVSKATEPWTHVRAGGHAMGRRHQHVRSVGHEGERHVPDRCTKDTPDRHRKTGPTAHGSTQSNSTNSVHVEKKAGLRHGTGAICIADWSNYGTKVSISWSTKAKI